MNFDATAGLPGKPPALITRRAQDARSYMVDCTALLREHELLVRVMETTPDTAPAGLRVQRAVVWGACTALLIDLAGGEPAAGRPSQDWPVSVRLKTTQGYLNVALMVRVHA